MEQKSTVTAGDLSLISVTMETTSGGYQTLLDVSGQIDRGAFVVNANCKVIADDGLTGSGTTAYDWTVNGGQVVAGVSSLWGDATLTAATMTFDRMVVSDQFGVSITLANGSTLELLHGEYDGEEPFPGRGLADSQNYELLFGEGNENILKMGQPEDDPISTLHLGNRTRVAPAANADTLEISSCAEFYIDTDFRYEFVYSGWDSRAVDLTIAAITSEQEVRQAFEIISPNLAPWYEGDPLIFSDVACVAVFRDLVLPEQMSPEAMISSATHYIDNSWIDDIDTNPRLDEAGPPEAGFFRDITVGAGRTLELCEVCGKLYYYGTRTIDPEATILYSPDGGPTIEVTPYTNPSLDELIVAAQETLYSDWDGSCTISAFELRELSTAIQEEVYDPLYDYNCDGVLTTAIDYAAAYANYLVQPDCGDSFGGGESEGLDEETEAVVAAVAADLQAALDTEALADFVTKLEEAAAKFDGTVIGEEMAALLGYVK